MQQKPCHAFHAEFARGSSPRPGIPLRWVGRLGSFCPAGRAGNAAYHAGNGRLPDWPGPCCYALHEGEKGFLACRFALSFWYQRCGPGRCSLSRAYLPRTRIGLPDFSRQCLAPRSQRPRQRTRIGLPDFCRQCLAPRSQRPRQRRRRQSRARPAPCCRPPSRRPPRYRSRSAAALLKLRRRSRPARPLSCRQRRSMGSAPARRLPQTRQPCGARCASPSRHLPCLSPWRRNHRRVHSAWRRFPCRCLARRR
jgi:hypothetical protein